MVFLSAGDGPVVAGRSADLLQGQAPGGEAIRAAAEMAAYEEIDPGSDIHASADFRRRLANVLARRALEQAFERAASGE
jgi:CO/xanthine dehydrogenase FAD-binding subunit